MSCSFQIIYGGDCGSDTRARKNEAVVPLRSCCKDIANHKKSLDFSGIETEVELILGRCGLFEATANVQEMTICPSHRSRIGIGWRRKSKLCSVPATISRHAKDSTSAPLAQRGIDLFQSRKLLELTSELIPIGSGA